MFNKNISSLQIILFVYISGKDLDFEGFIPPSNESEMSRQLRSQSQIKQAWSTSLYEGQGHTDQETRASWNLVNLSYQLSIQLCKVKRQYLLTCKVSRYCLLTLHGRIASMFALSLLARRYAENRYSTSTDEFGMHGHTEMYFVIHL